jgi:hypothetical protein
MALQDLQVGYLFSSTGSYELVARSMLNGALLAADEINASVATFRNTPRSRPGCWRVTSATWSAVTPRRRARK